ncbi:anti sigma factor C-terminal domain-containing protein [Paenibacillus sp. GCM10027626]|uniref:anti sigma factor C-terminal domain-containing protein n=1 Tax=Paenibacillus sp. GCM10027626 TaxID=3273411 RepID=UPI00362EA562
MSERPRKPQEDERIEQLLDEWREDNTQLPITADPVKWEKKQFKRLIWNTRFSLVRSVAIAALSLYFLYMLYLTIATIIYMESGKGEQFVRYAQTLVETHETGLLIDRLTQPKAELNGLLTQKTVLKAYWQVGDWQAVAGEVEVKKWLFGDVTYTLHMNERYLNEQMEYFFNLPPDPLQPENETAPDKTVEKWTDPGWERLAKMEDGYVGQLGFSTAKAMTPAELFQMLQKYKVRLLGMPIYAGELRTEALQSMPHSSSTSTIHVASLNLRPAVEYDGRYSKMFMNWIGNAEQLEKSQSMLIRDLEWLDKEGSYADKNWDLARLDFIRQHGVMVYGAVVTGPIRELERLKEEPLFGQFQFGAVEPWNWSDGE